VRLLGLAPGDRSEPRPCPPAQGGSLAAGEPLRDRELRAIAVQGRVLETDAGADERVVGALGRASATRPRGVVAGWAAAHRDRQVLLGAASDRPQPAATRNSAARRTRGEGVCARTGISSHANARACEKGACRSAVFRRSLEPSDRGSSIPAGIRALNGAPPRTSLRRVSSSACQV
jgi:hypothetical protein